MELLVILLGEFLLFPFFAAIAALGNLVISVVGLTLELVLNLLGCAVAGGSKEAKQPKPKHQRNFKGLKVLGRFALALFVLVMVGLFVLNTFLFKPTVDYIAAAVSAKTNTGIEYTGVKGNFFNGLFEFENLEVYKKGTSKFDLDFSIETLLIDIDVFSLISSPIIIEFLEADGIDGAVFQNEIAKIGGDKAPKTLKAKKGFIIEGLSITDANIEFRKHDKHLADIDIIKIISTPFRSNYAMFDTFFRSNILAEVNGSVVKIKSFPYREGRETTWVLEDFPAELAGAYIDKAPLNWITGGRVDIHVHDIWRFGEVAEIDMDWNLNFKDIEVEAPEGTSLKARAVGLPFVSFIKARGGDANIGFSLVMNEGQFESAYSLDTAGLWDAALGSMAAALSNYVDIKKEELKDGANKAVEGFKNFLNKKRQPDDP